MSAVVSENKVLLDLQPHFQRAESLLLQLDQYPGDHALLVSLQQCVDQLHHSILHPELQQLCQLIAQLCQTVQAKPTIFQPQLGDILLLLLTRINSAVIALDNGQHAVVQQCAETLLPLLQQLQAATSENWQSQLAEVLAHLEPGLLHSTEQSLNDLGIADDEELAFFRRLMVPVEYRSQYWRGRCDRIARFALYLNREAGKPVDELQLAVAAYTHDFGMAFLPLSLLHKTTTLSDQEILQLRSHVHSSAQLLQQMPQWQGAREMVIQHHEHVDGSGYPYGLRDAAICDGAKILALADSVDAITHQRAYPGHEKRSIFRAAHEINSSAGRQLSPYWVAVFNRLLEPMLQRG